MYHSTTAAATYSFRNNWAQAEIEWTRIAESGCALHTSPDATGPCILWLKPRTNICQNNHNPAFIIMVVLTTRHVFRTTIWLVDTDRQTNTLNTVQYQLSQSMPRDLSLRFWMDSLIYRWDKTTFFAIMFTLNSLCIACFLFVLLYTWYLF